MRATILVSWDTRVGVQLAVGQCKYGLRDRIEHRVVIFLSSGTAALLLRFLIGPAHAAEHLLPAEVTEVSLVAVDVQVVVSLRVDAVQEFAG